MTWLTISQWPPVKRKAIEAHPSFGAFLGSTPAAAKAAPAPKATPRKRKSGTPDGEETVKETTEVTPDEDGASPKKKKAPARSRGRPKKTKTDEAKTDEAKTDEVKTDEAKTDEVKTDEAKTDEAKADEAKADEAKAESEEGSSADRGDGLGEYTQTQKVRDWLDNSNIK